jgi:PAS domain S-box-containing protein
MKNALPAAPPAADGVREREVALLQQEGVYLQILDAIADMVLVKGARSRILWANRAFRDYYGMSNEQLRLLVDAPFNPPDNTLQYVADDERVFSTGQTLDIAQEVVTRHDGLAQQFNTVKSALRDEDGVVRMTVGVSRNITQSLRDRDELLRYREQLERDRLAAFASQLPGFLFQYRLRADGSEHVPFSSARVTEYYGASPEALAISAAPLFERVENPGQLQQALRGAASHQSSVHNVHRVQGPDGRHRWMELIGQPVREADGAVLFNGYVHDVTTRHEVQAEREQLISELKDRNTEMEQFTYTVSHDLKSPLVTIRGFLGAIEEDLREGKSERALSDLARVRVAAEKMSRMLAELLDLSRVGRHGHRPVEVRLLDLIEEVRELLAGRIADSGVVIEVSGGEVCVSADRTRLSQVFQNLIENAVKYMGDQSAPRVEIDCREAGEQVLCRVRDNGIGIAAAHHQRVFGIFEKLDPRSEGTGVGLALVKSIIDLHRGKVWVESAGPGLGSTFVFSMPRR